MREPKPATSDRSTLEPGRNAGRDPLLPGMQLDQIGEALASFYDSLVAEGVPEHLAGLVRRVRHVDLDTHRAGKRIALVVEDEAEIRALAETLLEETELFVVGCDSAERALGVLRECGGDVALVFADIRLAGQMDGIALANAVATLWPRARLVVTSGVSPERSDEIPPQAVFIPKPWLPIDVLVEAGRAVEEAPPAVS